MLVIFFRNRLANFRLCLFYLNRVRLQLRIWEQARCYVACSCIEQRTGVAACIVKTSYGSVWYIVFSVVWNILVLFTYASRMCKYYNYYNYILAEHFRIHVFVQSRCLLFFIFLGRWTLPNDKEFYFTTALCIILV